MAFRSWVIGRGLLGSAVHARLAGSGRLEAGPAKLPWESADLPAALARGAREVAAALAPGDEWEAIWCAGTAVVGTPADRIAREVDAWSSFLDALSASGLAERRGRVFLASSAGGVYAASSGLPFTEETAPAPLSDYGRAKLEQEERLARWAERHAEVSWIAGRITNLYGPGQNLAKGQGLISALCRARIYQRPVHLYVPVDTTRDYLYSDDAAELVLRSLDRLAASPGRHVKILASEEDTTIAVLLGHVRRLARRNVKVVSGASALKGRHPVRQSFRSRVWPDIRPARRTPLLEGIHRVYLDLLARYERGALPP